MHVKKNAIRVASVWLAHTDPNKPQENSNTEFVRWNQ